MKRCLYPKSTHSLPVVSRTQSSSLLLTIVGGRNVPHNLESMTSESTRVEAMKNGDGHHFLGGGEGEDCVGVLVKILFGGKRYQTKPVNFGSSSPQWKETFCIPLCEASEENLPSAFLDEVVHLSLFDCANVDLRHMGGFYEDEDSKHSEMRYLVRLPAFGSQCNSTR